MSRRRGESYKDSNQRAKKDPRDIFVVRNGEPDAVKRCTRARCENEQLHPVLHWEFDPRMVLITCAVVTPPLL